MAKKTHEDVMNLLKGVSGVSDHLNSPSVIKEKTMAKQKIELSEAYDFLFEEGNKEYDADYADRIEQNGKISGYELTVIFDKERKEK